MGIDEQAQEAYERIISLLREELVRACADKTQDDIADFCGVAQSTINRIIKGARGENLPLKTVLKIVLALDLDLGALLSPCPQAEKEKIKTLLAQLSDIIK